MPTPIDERVRQIVEQTIEPETGVTKVAIESTYEDLHMDSLAAIEVVLAVEEEWKIEIPDEEIEGGKVKSITDLSTLVKQKLREKGILNQE